MIPEFKSIEEALGALSGNGMSSLSRNSVGGGCISSAEKITLPGGRSLFVKSNSSIYSDMFETEALGLFELDRENAPSVPKPLAIVKGSKISAIILENITSAPKKKDFWKRFGRSLASLHQSGGSDSFGWERDNFIGSNPQKNSLKSSWIDFFAVERLQFQGKLAYKKSRIDKNLYDKLIALTEKLDKYIPEPEKPEPLHGDLWSGNYVTGPDGEAWIIDPAFYYGSGEADLAMTEMFGGYSREFYSAYSEVKNIPTEYNERKDIYNLYHYLNHLNLFGSGYYGSVRMIIERYV